jgi:hypothetical protein
MRSLGVLAILFLASIAFSACSSEPEPSSATETAQQSVDPANTVDGTSAETPYCGVTGSCYRPHTVTCCTFKQTACGSTTYPPVYIRCCKGRGATCQAGSPLRQCCNGTCIAGRCP